MAVVSSPAVTALGGGHGLAASLSALRLITSALTAVVTVADDGGSSGRLREELDILPPGDLRMALSALCDDSEWGKTWRDVLQYRFGSQGPLDQHAVGNLLIAALWERLGDPVAGLDLVAKLLRAHGRVLPMALQPLVIEAELRCTNGKDTGKTYRVRGQNKVALVRDRVVRVTLDPPDALACPESVAAISEADWVILGPGSWYSSVMPHLLLPQLRKALEETSAKRCLTLNLAAEIGETRDLSAAEHVQALVQHAPDFKVDVVLADPHSVQNEVELAQACDLLGAQLVLRDIQLADGSPRHDVLKLAAAYRDLFSGQGSQARSLR